VRRENNNRAAIRFSLYVIPYLSLSMLWFYYYIDIWCLQRVRRYKFCLINCCKVENRTGHFVSTLSGSYEWRSSSTTTTIIYLQPPYHTTALLRFFRSTYVIRRCHICLQIIVCITHVNNVSDIYLVLSVLVAGEVVRTASPLGYGFMTALEFASNQQF
jgi:hypothetical protein